MQGRGGQFGKGGRRIPFNGGVFRVLWQKKKKEKEGVGGTPLTEGGGRRESKK